MRLPSPTRPSTMNLSCRRPDPARSASVPIHFSALAARLLNRALLVLVAAITSGAGAGVAAQSAQAPGRVVVREVVRGETLIGIAHDMLDPQHSWQALAAFNELNKADRIRPGERLRVPAAWLKPLAVEAKVVSMSGDVREGGRQLKSGDVLSEGQALETGPDAVVTDELTDGSRL
ncbi:MAG TPA: LysM peptidoglycan-binding domain-containing protein, partial [Burkholderiaceae bacterium]|nr:LysM peptidoglycan-binding domain-containing protein [Burkholderiaceae bacterium]